ncbi:MAG TPA: FkbM family methyltransferase [Flavitalea sp.]|nr:FkbM family methyltransferase [Flavitalea sp.]
MMKYLTALKNYFKSYPRMVKQEVLRSGKLQFEVHNLIEEDRVTGSNSEIEFTEEIIKELKSSDNYFDVGSCIGFTAIAAAKNAGCRVFAFEPDAELAEHLRHNISLNALTDIIQVNQWAVSDKDGTIDFFTSGANGASPSLAQTQNQNRKISVNTYKIDSAIDQKMIEPPSVMKIDIEGAELMALKGMNKIFSTGTGPRTIFIESHPPFMEHFNHTIEMLQQYMKENNYKEVYMKKRGEEYHHKFIKLGQGNV